MEQASVAEEAQQYLMTLLQKKLQTLDTFSLSQFWPIYREFVQVGFGLSQDDDLLLFECSTESPNTNLSALSLSFMRQFSLTTSNGDYDSMEHMGCNFYYEPPSIGVRTSEEIWSEATDTDNGFGAYLSRIEALPVFQSVAMEAPVKVEFWNCKI